ncbi:hypothetical protein [Deinococcus maricopensis]|uniref:Uncharacterized protein n=1 Tax=Deinococcus maricopensis (strain DSM 21211 / LMG 22137 / NRRL B-23946 / LB-34) TaxID=709986 RepID=E8U604_DEIML|nr:hypothetical protein [Deinococcus maricopensis]ADV66493.1 hypothetical protein Deima_0838 [Deinococcus maricopensis DSM 21211]
MTTFAEVREQIKPLVWQELRDEPKPLSELTVDIICHGWERNHVLGLTPARVDLVLRQLERAGEIMICDNGEVQLRTLR